MCSSDLLIATVTVLTVRIFRLRWVARQAEQHSGSVGTSVARESDTNLGTRSPAVLSKGGAA